MIYLNSRDLIGCGSNRKVYRHPENANFCIKVDLNKDSELYGTASNEIEVFSKIANARSGKPLKAIANFHGSVMTNEGLGGVFDLIQDEGTRSPSEILFVTMQRTHSQAEKKKISQALKVFRWRVLQSSVVCNDISPFNVCVKKCDSGRIELFLVDGVGHPKFDKYGWLYTQVKLIRHLWRRKFFSYSMLKRRCSLNDMQGKYAGSLRKVKQLTEDK